jgi:DNA-binding LytR/AlgR family response regulator
MSPYILLHLKPNFYVVIDSHDILFIESNGRCTKLTTVTTSYILNVSLTQLEADLPADLFCRVHRAYIVQISRIIHINGNLIHLDNKDIPLARQYKKNLFICMKVLK